MPCIADNARLGAADVRARNFAALTSRLMAIHDAYRARIIAERAGSAAHVLVGYKDILDSMIKHRDAANWEKFALDETRVPQAVDLFSDDLPAKRIDSKSTKPSK